MRRPIVPVMLLLVVAFTTTPALAAKRITRASVMALFKELDAADIRNDYQVLVRRLSPEATIRWVGRIGRNSVTYNFDKKKLVERIRRYENDPMRRENRVVRIERGQTDIRISPSGRRAVVSSTSVVHGENARGPYQRKGRDEITLIIRGGRLWIMEYLFDTTLR